MPSGQSRSSPKKRKLRRVRRYLLHYLLLGVFCLAIAFVMCYTVFFKLEKIKISGCTVYGETQIVDEIGAKKGDSLFRINISNAEKKLAGKLPYIRSVKIRRQFPTTLRVEIQEEEVLGAIYTEEGFAIISTTGKVLE
ncbi:MAG: FtsQ-type POTRA domain-containing protein, partial [Negativibacillus sp.]|nr:FtsQ-type POTRA domain-containing protein [Negativibacillus sp.]